MKKHLFFIFLVALSLRFFNLQDSRCLNWDETTFAYNAYSILQTGKDEYGQIFPLQFKSIGDYKAPMYIYLMVPVIKILGLNEFAIRLVPSLFGSLSPIIFYLIVYEIFKDKRTAFFSSLFLAASPWHLQFTRAGADVAVSSFFVLVGILGFLVGLKKNWGFFLSAFGFVAATYSYFGDRFFGPLILLFLLILFQKKVSLKIRPLMKAFLFGLLILLPLIPMLFSAGHQEKIIKTTIFGYSRPAEYETALKSQEPDQIFYYLFHTGFFENTWGAVSHYLNHFSPTFLFWDGPIKDPRQFVFQMGMLYLTDLPLIILGVYQLAKKPKQQKWLVLGWLFLSPIPAAITRDEVHACRALNMVFPLMILAGLGAERIWNKLPRLLLILVFGGSVLFYLLSYYVFTPNRTFKGPAGWQCGYKEVVAKVSKRAHAYKEVVVDTSYQGPYVYFLFYQKYNPALYQPQARLIQESENVLGEGAGFDNYTFRPIYWPVDRCFTGKLFVGPPERLPIKDIEESEAKIIDRVYFRNGEEAFLLVEVFNPRKGYC